MRPRTARDRREQRRRLRAQHADEETLIALEFVTHRMISKTSARLEGKKK